MADHLHGVAVDSVDLRALREQLATLTRENHDLRDNIRTQMANYNRTGRRLIILGVLLEVMLGAVTIPLAIAVYSAILAVVEASPAGLVVPGVIVGIGVAVAGVFYAAAKMLEAIPAILRERRLDAERVLEALERALTADREHARS
jgi:hypothetical protein